MTYRDWCTAYGCTHAHCPCGCDHPQPFCDDAGTLWCGACWHVDGVACAMVPCTPVTCEEE